MLAAITAKVTTLKNELQANNGIIPDSWKPEIKIIEFLLTVARIFVPAAIKTDIDEILAAIQGLEN